MFLLSFISSVIGGFITGAIFYWLRAKDLRQEAEQLQRMDFMTDSFKSALRSEVKKTAS